jgi:hypothetical protein
MPRKVSIMEETEQPLSWRRALLSGWAASTLMLTFVDTFYMMGLTPFSFEAYLGSLIFNSSSGVHTWTVGLFANWVLGGVFGAVYAYFFENVFRRSGAREGIRLGLGHSVLAAIAMFPFFAAIREFMGISLYSNFGFFGSGLGAATPILIFFGHLIFGATMGTFYGPVGSQRVRSRLFDPWENIPKGEAGAMSEEEDAEDRIAM